MNKLRMELKGFEKIANKLQAKLNRFQREKKNIFRDPLKRTISNIRRQLRQDSKAGGIDHIFTGKLYSNTGAKFSSTSIGNMEILFGYFVPYGMNLETGGKPRSVTLRRLVPWAVKRFGQGSAGFSVQRIIRRKGSRAYPIIQRTWASNQQNYLKIVHGRFWKIWK